VFIHEIWLLSCCLKLLLCGFSLARVLFNPRHTASYFHISVIGVGRHTYNYFIFTIGYKLLTYGLGLFTEKAGYSQIAQNQAGQTHHQESYSQFRQVIHNV